MYKGDSTQCLINDTVNAVAKLTTCPLLLVYGHHLAEITFIIQPFEDFFAQICSGIRRDMFTAT